MLFMCAILKGKKYRRILYAGVAFILYIFNNQFFYILPFIWGVYIADICHYREHNTTYCSEFYCQLINNKVLWIILLIVGIFLGGVPIYYTGIDTALSIFRSIGVALLLFLFINFNPIHKVFEGKVMQFLGRLSFPIYSFHWPIMLSLQAFLFSNFHDVWNYNVSALLAYLISFVVILIVSYFVWKLSEVLGRV